MDIQYFIVAAVLAAIGVLVVLFWFGFGRRQRLKEFASQEGRRFGSGDEFGLQERLDRLFEPRERFAGDAVEVTEAATPVYLVDLYRDIAGPPRQSAILLRLPDAKQARRRVIIRERIPGIGVDEEDFDARFAIEGLQTSDLPIELKQWLLGSASERTWLLEVRWRGRELAVLSRDRPLQRPDEWQRLMNQAHAVARAWSPSI